MCDYCKKPGHTKDKCFKLHGYPESFGQSRNQNYNPNQQFNQNFQSFNRNQNFSKGKRIVANVHGDHSSEMPSNKGEAQCDLNTDQTISLSKEHYGQILNLLQHFQASNGGDNANTSNSINGAVNFAGIIVCTSSIDFGKLSCQCLKNKSESWILDSGASNHMTFNKNLLTNIITLPYPLLVVLPNGYKVKVTEIGSVALVPDITLHKVMFVPSFRYNLISIHGLTN
ncbi:hypothetical protein A4A49_57217, partial [Nicotiana attenuata]